MVITLADTTLNVSHNVVGHERDRWLPARRSDPRAKDVCK